MLGPDLRISLADLSAAGVRLRPVESVTIVRALALDAARDELPGVPSPHVIRFCADGRITVEGPVGAGGRDVQRAALLLESLLPGFDAPPELRVPGALRLVVARGLGTLDLPPYPSLESFAEALGRFASGDPQAVVADLVKSWSASVHAALPATKAEAVEPAASTPSAEGVHLERRADRHAVATPSLLEGQADRLTVGGGWELSPDRNLTISDIRRARRATRLTLSDISARTRIPVDQLRELEWGYFRHWPGGHYGRTQLIRYARASGLDDQIVVRTVWPMIQDHTAGAQLEALPPLRSPEVEVVDLEALPLDRGALIPMPLQAAAVPAPRRRWLAALAIPALLAIGLLPGVWSRSVADDQREAASPAAQGPAAASNQPRDRESVETPVPQVGRSGAEKRTPNREVAATTGVGAPRPAITSPESEAYSPSFASVGSAMFYHSGGALMRADTDGGGAVLRVTRIVDDNARNFHARPSPDGARIAFDSDREGERAVYIADADGKNVHRVSGEGFAAVPSWSPDGRTLAFVRSERDRPRVWNLWTVDLESGDLKRITAHRVGQPWGGSWFPDGKRIAYSHETRLIVRDLESGRERVYPSPLKGRLVRTPAVSPDGRRIIFQVYQDGAWLLELGDGSMRRVLADSGAEEYTWSPDGRRVAYHSRRSGDWGVWIMATR